MSKYGINSEAYVSYQSRNKNPHLHEKADVSVSNHVPMNSVSAGHPVIGKPIRNVQEARLQMKKAAGLTTEK